MSFSALTPARFPWFDASRYSFSLGLKSAAGTYLSGHTASEYDPATRRIVVRGGMADQVRTVWAKIGAILESGGLAYDDVTRVVEYVTPRGIDRYAEAAAIRSEVFGEHRPVLSTVPVRSLVRPDALIEVEVTASSAPGNPSGAVFLPTIQPVDDRGEVVGAGDVVAQTRAIFERAGEMLAALGLGFDRVVKTVAIVAPAARDAYGRTAGVRRDYLGPVGPAAVAVLMPRLLRPEALIQYDFIATREAAVAVAPGPVTRGPAVRAGSLLFLSSQASLDPATEGVVHEGDVVAQAECAYRNLIEALKAAGGGPQNLVKTIEYVTPAALARYREVANVREKLLRKPWPVSTGIVCEGLFRPGIEIEVEPLAVLG